MEVRDGETNSNFHISAKNLLVPEEERNVDRSQEAGDRLFEHRQENLESVSLMKGPAAK